MTTLLADFTADLQHEPPFPAFLRRWRLLFTLFVVLFVLLVPLLAHAQDVPSTPAAHAELGPVAAPPVALPAGVPDLEAAPLQFAGVLVQLGQQGRWGALAALAVFAVVFLARKFVGKLPGGKFRDFMLSTWGGWLLNLLVAGAAAASGLALAGASFSLTTVLGVVGGALTYSLSAAGLVELQKDATKKGAAASAAVDTKSEAVSLLEKGPPVP